MWSNLPRDLAEEVFSRLPAKSMCAVRSTCKKWNTLSKNLTSFKIREAEAKATARTMELTVIMVMQYRVSLMSLNLHEGVEPSINHQGKLVNLTDSDQVKISEAYHCDGLLLCIVAIAYKTRFFVLNPYCGQTRWFEPPTYDPAMNYSTYAIGYDNSKSCCSHKVLRFYPTSTQHIRNELYYLNSKSPWDITISITILSDWEIVAGDCGVSVKGNTYWLARRQILLDIEEREIPDFLICFDFTRERFGPRLSLPFHTYNEDIAALSSVRNEQLAVLCQRYSTLHMEIWITSKIEPEMASWSKLFLSVDMSPLTDDLFRIEGGSFFVDDEKKVFVVFDRDDGKRMRIAAYIIGEDGYFKKIDVGASSNMYAGPPVVCSYVPSLAQTKRE